MTSTAPRKRKSPEPDRVDGHIEGELPITPTEGPARKKLKISQSQKQALIDNLQLEITERARRLRAQYALQAQDLRSRIHRRVNRIPMALRKTTMGELLERHTVKASSNEKPQVKKPAVSKNSKAAPSGAPGRLRNISTSAPAPRQTRRANHENDGNNSDKENMSIENPKKRRSKEDNSRFSQIRGAEAKILSPKSSNSRTYPQSPIRSVSPHKSQQGRSYMSRPVSPLKPASPLKAMIENARARANRELGPDLRRLSPPVAPTTSSAATRKPRATTVRKPTARPGTRAAAAVRSPSRPATRQQDRMTSGSTTSSNVSSGTTIVRSARSGTVNRRPGTGATGTTAAATAKRIAAGPPASATAKRAAARKVDASSATTTTGRVLRKRT